MITEGVTWRWDDADPLTQTVVAVFSDGINQHPAITAERVNLAANTAFPANDDDGGIFRGVELFGGWGTRNAIISGMAGLDLADVDNMFRSVGSYAGGSEAQTELAEMARSTFASRSNIFDTIPTLRVLSEIAVQNLAE